MNVLHAGALPCERAQLMTEFRAALLLNRRRWRDVRKGGRRSIAGEAFAGRANQIPDRIGDGSKRHLF